MSCETKGSVSNVLAHCHGRTLTLPSRPPGEPSTSTLLASAHATHATCSSCSPFLCFLPTSLRCLRGAASAAAEPLRFLRFLRHTRTHGNGSRLKAIVQVLGTPGALAHAPRRSVNCSKPIVNSRAAAQHARARRSGSSGWRSSAARHLDCAHTKAGCTARVGGVEAQPAPAEAGIAGAPVLQ